MPEPRRLHLRILYTINSSSYILARSPVPVPVIPINDHATKIEPYGAVSFKTCLEAICRSSPELIQDQSRDFSVYVLDPLESNAAPAPMDISNSTHGRSTDTPGCTSTDQTHGVAVGMGLMSWALSVEEKDPITVVGTLGKTGTGQDAIEVIIALRETASMDRTKLPSSSHSWGKASHVDHTRSSTPCASSPNQPVSLRQGKNATTSTETLATIASIQMRTKTKNKPKKPPRVSSTPMTESDKLMSADTYIGPVKKKGRPKGPAGEAKVKTEEPAPGLPQNPVVPSPAPMSAICIGTSTTTTIQSITNTNATHSQTPDSNMPSSSGGLELATLAALFSATQNEAAQNAFLLNALSLIDSPASQSGAQAPANPALVDALRQFLNNAYVQAQLQTTSATPAPPPVAQSAAQPASTLPGNVEEIVLLDKENVNPATFRRHAEQKYEQAKLADNAVRTNGSTTESANAQQPTRGLGARFLENSPPKAQPAASSSSTNTTSLLRKRTLDDCMEERDNKRNKSHRSRGKEKERSDRKELPRLLNQQQSHDSGLRHYPRALVSTFPRPELGTNSYYRTPVDAWTSPPRPSRQDNVDRQLQTSDPLGGTSRNRPIVIPDSPQAPKVSASSPIKPTNGARKPYTVPAWARTNTATQPRLSEEAQRAVEAAAEKKREERRANRRKTNAAAQERARQRGRTANSENSAPNSEPLQPSESNESMRPPPRPVVSKSDLPPIIASTDADLILFPAPNQRTRSPSPTPRSQIPPPVTPKRPSKVTSSTPGTAEYDGDSLFTPISIARRSTGKGSPLFSPGMFGSPLARKKPRISSPTSYRSATMQLGSESSVTTTKVNENSEDTLNKSKSPRRDELDEGLEDSDCPPSSLPIASSDVEFDEPTARDSATANDGTEVDDEDPLPRKQHWIGLPPSSPPPPSSPGLMPMEDDTEISGGDVDDNELPVASETDEPEDERPENAALNATESDWDSSPAADDMTISLPGKPLPNNSADQDVADDLAFLEQFTNIGSTDGLSDLQGDLQEDSGLGGGDLSSLFPGGLHDMDLNGFLETFKPMIQDGSVPKPAEQEPTFDLSSMDSLKEAGSSPQTVDHTKLAADLQALFSGCLV